MKKLAFLLAIMFIASTINAQDEEEFRTIFDNKITKVRGFGGPDMCFTTIDGEFAHMMGGGGGLILNDQLIFGGWGMGMTNSIPAKVRFDNNGDNEWEGKELDYGVGGLWFGYIIQGKKPIHPVIHAQIGWGEAEIADNTRSSEIYSDGIFVLNPIIELEMNITQFFRLGVGANYRFNFGTSLLKNEYSNSSFSGPGGFLSFKFGWF